MDSRITILELKERVKEFCEARDWDQFHGAKDLAIGAVTEASELLELFRFLTEKQVEELMSDSDGREKVAEELSDVLFFIIRLSQRYQIDLADSFANKMKKNTRKYPVEEFKGKNHKSNHRV